MTDLRVIVDGRALVGNPTGIGVHTAEIASRLGVTPAPLICTQAPVADQQSLAGCRFRVDPSINGVWWQQVRLPAIARQERADVVWGPHTTLPLALDTPAVVSAHDLSSITMPGRHRLKTILSFNLFVGRSLENAAAIAAVSRHTADEMMRGFAIPSYKITIVPNGVDEFFCPAGRDEPDLPLEAVRGRDYLLFVGTLEPRKGIDDLLTAWRSLPRRPLLVLCGDRGWGRQAHTGSDAASEIVRTGFVSRSQLRALYRHAFAFVYPSRHEGFGLPPLEAMACGTPVITTRAGAIPEVVGDAALLVEPAAPAELAAALTSLISDQGRRRELSQRGIERASMFGWKRSAELMRELLMGAARGRRES